MIHINPLRLGHLVNGTATLTKEEQKEWHFCWDWDGMLIHKDDPEFECCSCVGGDIIRRQK